MVLFSSALTNLYPFRIQHARRCQVDVVPYRLTSFCEREERSDQQHRHCCRVDGCLDPLPAAQPDSGCSHTAVVVPIDRAEMWCLSAQALLLSFHTQCVFRASSVSFN